MKCVKTYLTGHSEAPDINLYIGVDSNRNGQPSADEERCASATAMTDERCDISLAGDFLEENWWVLVQNRQASAIPPDAVSLAVAHVPRANLGNFDVTEPDFAAAFEPFDIEVFWDADGLNFHALRICMLQCGRT